MSETCHRRTLAETSTCKIHLCDCGVVHLELGPLTLRLDAEAIRSLGATLDEAVQELRSLGWLSASTLAAASGPGRGHAN